MSHEVHAINRVREQTQEQVGDLNEFDYGAPAELFPSRNKSSKKSRGQVTYKRFDTAAQAIRFAVEEMPLPALFGACLEVDEVRFGRREIQYLYENAAYPLKRRGTELAPNGAASTD